MTTQPESFWEKVGHVIDDLMDMSFFIFPFILIVLILVSVLYIAYIPIKHAKADYEKYGCYPIEREYEECGPIDGKPGFTKCVKKKEKVCPEQ